MYLHNFAHAEFLADAETSTTSTERIQDLVSEFDVMTGDMRAHADGFHHDVRAVTSLTAEEQNFLLHHQEALQNATSAMRPELQRNAIAHLAFSLSAGSQFNSAATAHNLQIADLLHHDDENDGQE
jgi:hypothetical protein